MPRQQGYFSGTLAMSPSGRVPLVGTRTSKPTEPRLPGMGCTKSLSLEVVIVKPFLLLSLGCWKSIQSTGDTAPYKGY